MIGWITLILATFGLSIAITYLHIGHPLRLLVSGMTDREFADAIAIRFTIGGLYGFRQRVLARAIRCPACAGFWAGLGLSMWWWPEHTYMWEGWVDAACTGLVTCGTNFILWLVAVRLGADKL